MQKQQNVSNQQQQQSSSQVEESTDSMASGMVGSDYSEQQSRIFSIADQQSKKTVVSLEDVTVPISLCLLVMVSYIVGGALLFSEWEGWGYLEGSYFCFITLSTIGFGDMVPGDAIANTEEEETLNSPINDDGTAKEPIVNTKFILCSLYILIGMALIAMCFNLMQEKVIKGVRSLGKRLASKNKKAEEA